MGFGSGLYFILVALNVLSIFSQSWGTGFEFTLAQNAKIQGFYKAETWAKYNLMKFGGQTLISMNVQ